MEIQEFIVKRLESAKWRCVPVTLAGLSEHCLVFKKNNLVMLIQTGVVSKIQQRDEIRKTARQNAILYRRTHSEPDIYYGHVTNETIPHIKCLYKL